ncbi:hypothetical protein ACWCW7_34620 [Nocardia tengchongensis]
MATATVQVAEVGGYAGTARCFKIDPPFEGHDYVTVVVIPRFGELVRPKVEVFPANETGACAELSRMLMARPGSFVLHDDPDTPQRIEGAYWLALQLLGGHTIEVQDA